MKRLLVPVRVDRAIGALEREVRTSDRPYVVVLSVQPKPVEWQTRGLFREEIKSHLIARGRAACEPIAACLSAAGIAHHIRVELGEEIVEIVRCASEEQCDGIVMLADHFGWPHRWFTQRTGCSTEGRVIHSTKLPVTVVH